MREKRLDSHSVFSGDFNKTYTVENYSIGGPHVVGVFGGEQHMTIAAKWIGACKADQKPGDMIFDDRTVNVFDLQKTGR